MKEKDIPSVILYSTTLHQWEVWKQGRPLARATHLPALEQAYPGAMKPSQTQLLLAAEDARRR